MISVAIFINGTPIMARSAVNRGRADGVFVPHKEMCKYEVDDGSVIEHDRAAGAVALAIEMLKTIKEPKGE